MWEKITAIGTVILIALTAVLVWQGFNRPSLHPALAWSGIALLALCLVTAAILNYKATKIKHLPSQNNASGDSVELSTIRAKCEELREKNKDLSDNAIHFQTKFNQSLEVSGQFKLQRDEVYGHAILWWLKEVCRGSCSFKTGSVMEVLDFTEEQALGGLAWLKSKEIVKQNPLDWSFIPVRTHPEYRRFSGRYPWRENTLREKSRYLAADLFQFLRDNPMSHITDRGADEPQRDYLLRVVTITGPWVEKIAHGYEAKFRQRVTQLYHELSAEGVNHGLAESDIQAQPMSAATIRTIAESLIMMTARMDIDQLALGAAS